MSDKVFNVVRSKETCHVCGSFLIEVKVSVKDKTIVPKWCDNKDCAAW